MAAPKTTLLIVEGDTFTRTSMIAYLKAEKYDVVKANSGVKALEIIRGAQPDLVISDLRMTELGGLELLKKINVDHPQLPVIITSCEENMGNVIKALQHGARDYIQKPIKEMGLLKHSIERTLSHTTLQKAHDSYRKDIEWLVEKRTRELSSKNNELIETVKKSKLTKAQLLQVKKIAKMEQFTANIAHEISTQTELVHSHIDSLNNSFPGIIELVKKCWNTHELVKKSELTHENIKEIEELGREIDWEYLVEEIPGAIKQSRDRLNRIDTIVTAMKQLSHSGGEVQARNSFSK